MDGPADQMLHFLFSPPGRSPLRRQHLCGFHSSMLGFPDHMNLARYRVVLHVYITWWRETQIDGIEAWVV